MSKFDYNNKDLDDICSPFQLKMLTAYREHGDSIKAAKAEGTTPNTVRATLSKIKAKANKHLSPLHDATINPIVPDGYHVKGASSAVRNADGLITWIKTDIDKIKQAELMQSAIAGLCKGLPKIKPVECGEHDYSDMLAVYPLGDPHVGMMSWEPETGQDWDLNIAKKAFTGVFDRLVKTAPNCKEALIVNLGDYFHADNMEGVTSRSGHKLDLDGRYSKMIEAGMFIIRRMIRSALEHHEHVTVINAIGNHDDTSAQWLSVALSALYENEPRVSIRIDPAPFHYFEFGEVLIGVHHGHTCKMQNLPGVMAADKAQEWGRTNHRYWLTGHIHHDSMKEYPGVKCESFRTIAAKDAYAAWGGYRAGNDSKCLVMHKKHGEVERHTVTLDMI